MGRCRFVQPEIVRLEIGSGDDREWVEVKKRLTVGEARAAMAAVIGEVNADGWRKPNLSALGLTEVAAYLVDWSLRDTKGKPVPATLDSLKNLDEATFAEIDAAIDKHKAAMEAEVEAAKKSQAGAVA
jgi:hypothetical protein